MFDNCIYKWDHIPLSKKEHGYEDLMDQLRIIDAADFERLEDSEQDELVDVVLKTIRERNVYPIYYFNEEGIKQEILKVIDKHVEFRGDYLITQAADGLLLLDYLFPNLHRVKTWNLPDCMYDRFYDDAKLSKCIKRYMQNYKFNNMRTMFFMYGRFFWNAATNFAPIRAKAIVEKFAPANSTIYDFSSGFGGRMLGILSSNKNYKYIGCEPCNDTYHNLLQLGAYIEKVTGRNASFSIIKACSEELHLEPESIDFAFSSPPFFKVEIYSDEETQSTNRYSEYKDWLEYYIRPTLQNVYDALKYDGSMGINIYNFFYKARKYYIVDDIKRIASDVGFEFDKSYPIISRSRKSYEDENNIDQVFIFNKTRRK